MRPRIIPVLLVEDGGLVKTISSIKSLFRIQLTQFDYSMIWKLMNWSYWIRYKK